MLSRIKTISELLDIARNHQVCLASSVSISLQLLSKDTYFHLFALFCRNSLHFFLGYRQDTASTTSTIIDTIGIVLQLVLDRHYGKVGKIVSIV